MKRRVLSIFLSLALFAVLLAVPAATELKTEAATVRHAGYSFDRTPAYTDEGGVYAPDLSLFAGVTPETVDGYRGKGSRGYLGLPSALFAGSDGLSVAFWAKFSRADALKASGLFYLSGTKGESAELSLSHSGSSVTLTVRLSDGKNVASCSVDYTQFLEEEAGWDHIAFTYKKSGKVSLLTLYVNGASKAFSSQFTDLSAMKPQMAYLSDFPVDEVYIGNYALEKSKINSLITLSMANFYAMQEKELNVSSDTDTDTDPDSGSGSTSGTGTDPVTQNAYGYNWAAYVFEDTAGGNDLHGNDNPCTVDYSGCSSIKSENLKQKFGYALIRRENAAPASYLTLDPKLFSGQTQFTFACWIYRSGKTRPCQECLLELSGGNTIRFAPYSVEADGNASAYLEYTDASGRILRKTLGDGKPANPLGNWVHYAITVDAAGTITVYVNAAAIGAFSSGVRPAVQNWKTVRVVTGSSATDATRTAIDEIYVAPRALDAAEIRKVSYHGVAKYTTEAVPDPKSEAGDPVAPTDDPYAPDAVDRAEDAYTQTAKINGFVGTTFDSRADLGADWNHQVKATATGGQLTKGVASYGLALNGSSFLRYPAGILDGASSLTVGISYLWSGVGEGETRSQRLFDFSRKTSSVADPAAYLYLETGNGVSGLRLGMSDGVHSTYLTCDYTATDTWTRVTVTVENGKATVWINDRAAATGYTDVDLTAICPNYCYVGRSGVKGDPMFRGTVDEIYLADRALTPSEVVAFLNGIDIAINGERTEERDIWGTLVIVIIVVAAVLVLTVVAIIIITVTRKDKRKPVIPEMPPMPPSSPVSDQDDGDEDDLESEEEPEPSEPRRSRHAARNPSGLPDEEEATVTFRTVSELHDLDVGEFSDESTTEFTPVRSRRDRAAKKADGKKVKNDGEAGDLE